MRRAGAAHGGGHGDSARGSMSIRDPRVGSCVAAALVLVLAGDVAALASMTPARALVALVVAGAVSRLAVVGVIVLAPYGRQTGLGGAAQGSHRGFDLVLAAALTALVCLLDPRRGV